MAAALLADAVYTGRLVRAQYLGASVPVHAATPALWVVNDSDTIIYLFGTFHALDQESRWFDQAVRTAFTASDELVLETLVPRPPAPAFSNRSPAQHFRPVAQPAPGTSYLDTSKAVMSAGRTKGLSTDHGAVAVLRDVADIEGKRVGGLESFDFQMRMFGRASRTIIEMEGLQLIEIPHDLDKKADGSIIAKRLENLR